MLRPSRPLLEHKQKSGGQTKRHTLRVLAFFWHPKIEVTVGAYKRFVDVLDQIEDYGIEYGIIENQPAILHRSSRHRVYEFAIPFNYSNNFSKIFCQLYSALKMTFLGIKTCHKERYDLLIAPVGELSCAVLPVYVTHLFTRIPWTTIACNVPEAYAVLDSSGQLVVSLTKTYKYYRSLGFGIFNAFLMSCYSFFPKLILPKIYNRARAILSLNKSLSLYLRSLRIHCKIFPVGAGLNLDEIAESNASGVARYSAMYLGRFVPEKGVFDALKIWRRVTDIFPQATLLLVGYSDKATMSSVKSMINEFNLSKNIQVVGPIVGREKYALLKSSDLFLYPSRFETFGYVIAEAMACGLPVVCCDAPYVRELFTCPAVLKAPMDDIDGAAALVCDLLKDDEKRLRLGKEALEYVRRYEWSEVARKEAEIYRAVLNLNQSVQRNS